MSSSAMTKQQPNEVARKQDDSDIIEETETSSKASASAGLNLNIFGAIAGAFSSNSSKQIEGDGSSTETKQENLAAKGAGAGNLAARGAADTEQQGRHMKAIQDDPA
ncbi:hypothetical protein TI39_contig300g00022 [Zymoseptoria brevis]|uniref:SMP domain-containing protein n=1 Tax=Zymoseptoria brevis TaxID=1047168 RepID=A0A0F4GVE5_9PEZI|nr:hypothetical protein TI39_contig300g00022 [Zymoseptoria brevis]